VCVDEAHCISLWGGSFRPDYAELGTLHARVPTNVPFVLASATLPEHILDDIRERLQISKDFHHIQLTNARPNIALSVRVMKFADESKADLRFVVPHGATLANDIPTQLIYCNDRTTTEDIIDKLRGWLPSDIPRSCIAFYHAKIGTKRKRQIEEELQSGEIRIVSCTDAVGMGCDMRNIQRVILWGLPPSFCALVQQAGRAARDLTQLGEAVLIISSVVRKSGIQGYYITSSLEDRGEDELVALETQGIEVTHGCEVVDVCGRGARLASNDDETIEVPQNRGRKTGRSAHSCNSLEARYLSKYANTPDCHCKVWDEFFLNRRKRQLIFPDNTTYRHLPNARCCDNCQPALFPVDAITLDKVCGLKAGKKRKVGEDFEQSIRDGLTAWRDGDLIDCLYPGTFSIAGATVLDDTVIEQLATCGEWITNGEQLSRRTR
ncbi:P-loop containing nucleoside triphosphate hydrolase protein, partial [Suillus tomentosus]